MEDFEKTARLAGYSNFRRERGRYCHVELEVLYQGYLLGHRQASAEQPQASAAQSAPAGEREAVAYEHWKADMESYGFSGLDAFQAGAAWQRTQSEGVPSVQISGHLDEVDAPVWDFINAEARKLGTITGSIDNYGLSRPNGAQPNGGVAVLWNGQKIHAIAVVVRDAMNRTQCVRVLTAAPAQQAAQSVMCHGCFAQGVSPDHFDAAGKCKAMQPAAQGECVMDAQDAGLPHSNRCAVCDQGPCRKPAAQDQGEVHSRERWTVMCGHWQDTTLAIHGERTGHIASGIDEDAAHAIVNAHNQGLPPIAAASTGQEVNS